MSSWFATTKKYALAHKAVSAIVAVVVLWGGWSLYSRITSTSGVTHYALGTVTKGTVIASVSASGQVSTTQQLDLKPKVTGEILYVGVTPGQHVTAGTLIAEIDPTDAEKAVRDAQANLDSAELSLQKIKEPADTLTMTQSQNALDQSQTALAQAYSTTETDITTTFIDIPDIVTGLQDVVEGTEANHSQWNIDYYRNQAQAFNISASSYRDDAYNAFTAAQVAYNSAITDYKNTDLATANTATVERLLKETNDTTKAIATAVKSAAALIQFYKDQLSSNGQTLTPVATTQLSQLNGYTGKLGTHLSALLSDVNALAADAQNLTEKQQSLQKTQGGADPLDIQSQELSVTKSQNALLDAQNTLSNYYIRAPFAGTIASVAVNKYDQAGSTAVASLITQKQIATLSLNEVDAAKIMLGQKATLTFDAIDSLTLTGTVAEIDPVGTVTQGVVSYTVKIGFDTQDTRVKPGMTVNASIQTAIHTDVLTVPSSAVKTQNSASYVQVFTPALTYTGAVGGVVSATAPGRVDVQVGLSDDTNTEITSGLKEGDQIVTRTITGTQTATPTTSSGSSRGGFGGGGGIRL